MSFHHGRTTRGATALVTAFAAAAFVVQMAMPSALAVATDATVITVTPPTVIYAAPGTATTTATATDVNGDPVADVVVTFTETGSGGFDAGQDGDLSLAGIQVTTDADGVATVTTSSSVAGDEIVTGRMSDSLTSCVTPDCADSSTITWDTTGAAARFIDVSPDTAINVSGTVHIVTATVTDVGGNPVEGVLVDFSETGTGFFVFGSDTTGVLTDANGQAQAFTTTFAGQVGDETITGDIDAANTGGTPNDCTLNADDPNDGDAAGICSEDVTKTWTAAPVTTTHARTISLRLSDGLRAKGTVTVTDGFTACAASVPVKVQRHVSGHWKTLKTKTTSATGAYHAHLNNRHGSYRAVAPKGTIGTDVCLKATSPTRTH